MDENLSQKYQRFPREVHPRIASNTGENGRSVFLYFFFYLLIYREKEKKERERGGNAVYTYEAATNYERNIQKSSDARQDKNYKNDREHK